MIRLIYRCIKYCLIAILLCLGIIIALCFTYRSINPYSIPILIRVISEAGYKNNWLAQDRIPQYLLKSILVAEDGEFCKHKGIDWVQMERVIQDLEAGKNPRGASTITMQLARNLFLWRTRSYFRKSLELPIALIIDKILSKQRILEIYVNIAELGPGIFGFEAASKHYFNRTLNKLNKQEIALLVTTLPIPLKRNPEKPGNKHRTLAINLAKRTASHFVETSCL